MTGVSITRRSPGRSTRVRRNLWSSGSARPARPRGRSRRDLERGEAPAGSVPGGGGRSRVGSSGGRSGPVLPGVADTPRGRLISRPQRAVPACRGRRGEPVEPGGDVVTAPELAGVETFRIVSFDFDPGRNVARFDYAFDDTHNFQEVVEFGGRPLGSRATLASRARCGSCISPPASATTRRRRRAGSSSRPAPQQWGSRARPRSLRQGPTRVRGDQRHESAAAVRGGGGTRARPWARVR